jgi:lycopene cyclase domain-containing protein
MPEYALILLLFILLGFFLQRIFKLKLYKSIKHFLIANSIFLVTAILWDQIAISRGHWLFKEEFLLGFYVGSMPIEEIGFTLIIWYFGLVIYKLVEQEFISK